MARCAAWGTGRGAGGLGNGRWGAECGAWAQWHSGSMALFVLVHSPSVGPATWQPVAGRLRELGHEAVVPSLLGVGDGGPPFWPRVVEAVRAGLADGGGGGSGGGGGDEPVVLVAHSNAGVFMPVVVRGLGRPVRCLIFADATIPGPGEATPMAEEEFLPFLRDLAGPDGRLPRWTDWWGEVDLGPMFPDARTRDVITAEQPRLPYAYYLEQVPAFAGWDEQPCGYVRFSEGYEGQAARARERGWPVLEVPGEHLHQIVDPDAVANAILALAASP